MRDPFYRKNNTIAYAKEARTGADQDRSIVILDDTGDKLSTRAGEIVASGRPRR
jgi:hypothetical protein